MKTNGTLHQIDVMKSEQNVKQALDWLSDIVRSNRYNFERFIAVGLDINVERQVFATYDIHDLIYANTPLDIEYGDVLTIGIAIANLKPLMRSVIIHRYVCHHTVEEIRVYDPSYYAHIRIAYRHLSNILGLTVYENA
ncbi:MAG: hypothetical protein ACRCZJ_05460 [Erysipelotrichaceae bacterium]